METVVYCLENFQNGLTYVGVTNNFPRRLRQHNGELKGGAKYTTNNSSAWRPFLLIKGFPGRQTALQHEYRLHGRVSLPRKQVNPFGKTSRGRRLGQIQRALTLPQFTSKAIPTNELKLKLHWQKKSLFRLALQQQWASCVCTHVCEA
jgi:predicted GIY-YIG superfamily endonuclease